MRFALQLIFGMLLIGCTNAQDHGSRHLQPEDVTGLPQGTARGTTYSGVYRVAAAFEEACSCRRGDPASICGTVALREGAMTSIEQTDGRLRMLVGSDAFDGGVQGDGTFTVGGTGAILDTVGAEIGYALVLVDGSITGSGTATRLEATYQTSLVFSTEGQSFDCDLTIAIDALRQ